MLLQLFTALSKHLFAVQWEGRLLGGPEQIIYGETSYAADKFTGGRGMLAEINFY